MVDKIKKLLAKETRLKAKEVAKKLGFDKTEVNSILYKFKNVFEKDEEHRWTLIQESLSIVFSDKWVDSHNFEKTFSDRSQNINAATKIIFVISKDCSFMLEAIARLLAVCNQLQEKKIALDFNENYASRSYFNRVGFFDQLDKKVEVLPERPKTSTAKSHKGKNKNLVEFGAVNPNDNNKDLINNLADSFVALSSDKYQDPAFTIFSELITNVKDHSKSQLNGFAALQVYKPINKSAHIQTVVSDSGLGIVATLRPHLKKFYPELESLSDCDLVKKVMTEGRITQHGKESGRGLGFEASSKKALKYNAKYSVRQHDFSLDFIIRDGVLIEVVEKKDLIKILGTHICFDFDIDESESPD